MRTAVVRVRVDPDGALTAAQLRDGMRTLRDLADGAGAGLVDNDLSAMPVARREVELLMAGPDPLELKQAATELCANAFGTAAGGRRPHLHQQGHRRRRPRRARRIRADRRNSSPSGRSRLGRGARDAGKADLARVPESRIHTALEASLNCEVHIHTRLAISGRQEVEDRGGGRTQVSNMLNRLTLPCARFLGRALPRILGPWRVDQRGTLDQAAHLQ